MELNARYVIVSPETPVCKDHEIGKFVGHGNEIRQVGIIKNRIIEQLTFTLKSY